VPQKIGQVRIEAIALRKINPKITLEAVAIECGVTKQRIFKIFKDEGIKKAPKPFPNCLQCGILLESHSVKLCSTRCETKKYYTSQPCSACGQLIKIRKYILRYKLSQGQYNFFCARTCYNNRNIHINKIMGERT
jgi:hypothetical protein